MINNIFLPGNILLDNSRLIHTYYLVLTYPDNGIIKVINLTNNQGWILLESRSSNYELIPLSYVPANVLLAADQYIKQQQSFWNNLQLK